ncbi:MAG: hypothetical protein R2710_05220 [Acidimicrobiales bacterium]
MDFLNFVAKYSIGDRLIAPVDRYSSHGCYLNVSGAQAYLPLKSMGDPPPTRAAESCRSDNSSRPGSTRSTPTDRGINVVLLDALQRQRSHRRGS